jgi:DNA-binding GntR family transcriptional regulator
VTATPIRPIDPAQRSTLGAIVTEQLREHVIHGRFEPGTVLGEVSLAAQFGVSRGPVREALQRLVQEGLLRREPKRGISVPRLASADLGDIYLAREAIEGAALAVIVSRGPGGLPAELDDIVERMRRAILDKDDRALADLDFTFHHRIIEAARSPRLLRLYSTLIGETFAYFNMGSHHPRRVEVVAQHAEMAALIADRNLGGLQQALKRHLTGSHERGIA